jgi:hypothetical protein
VWLVPAARIRFNRNDLLRMLALSVLWVAVPFTLFPIAEQWISSGLTGLLNGAMPIFAVTISSLMLARLPRRIQLLGLAVGFAGVGLIAFPGIAEGPSEATGVMLALLATVCYRLADSALAAGPLLAVGALGVVGTGSLRADGTPGLASRLGPSVVRDLSDPRRRLRARDRVSRRGSPSVVVDRHRARDRRSCAGVSAGGVVSRRIALSGSIRSTPVTLLRSNGQRTSPAHRNPMLPVEESGVFEVLAAMR